MRLPPRRAGRIGKVNLCPGLARVVAAVMAAGWLSAAPSQAGDGDAIGSSMEEEAVVTEDGSRLWFVEFSGRPTSENGDLVAIAKERAAFRSEASRMGLRYRERMAFSRLWNGLSVAVDPGDVDKLDRLTSIQGRFPILAAWIPEENEVTNPDLLTALSMTGADIAQNSLGLTGAGIKVGIIDTGVDYDHPDLGGDGVTRKNSGAFPTSRIVGGWDFVGDCFTGATDTPAPDPYPDDCWGHGTHVAGILAANGSVRGVAPGVTMYVYRVFGCSGSTPADIAIAAMERALDDGVQIVNMSFGTAYRWPSYPTSRAADRLVNRGVVMVASAGNNGSTGLYSCGAPGVAKKVIGVASFENTHINLSGFSISPDGQTIPYVPAVGTVRLSSPPASGSYPVSRTEPDACAPLEPGSLAGKVALVRGGLCDVYQQCRNAEAAGALAVVLYPTFGPASVMDVSGDPPITIPVVSISATDGVLIESRLVQGPVQLTWGAQVSIPNPMGGLISVFSSYGLAPDLTFKPDLGAPGGFLRSTYLLEQGAYANISGTSMSSPHVAGAVALLLEARPRTASNAVRDILMNTAEPHALAADLSKFASVHHQGAGMLNIPAAILATTRIEPGKLALGESEFGSAQQTLVIHNQAASAVTYDISSLTAAGTEPNTFDVRFNEFPALVGFSQSPVTIAGGGSASVDVVVSPHPDQPQGSVYGGYILFSPRGDGQQYRVPYMGFAGDYQSIPAMTPAGIFALPWLAQRVGTVFFNRPQGATYSMQGSDTPYFIVHLDHPSSLLRMEVFDAVTRKPWHRALDMKDAPRNATSQTATVIPWNGGTSHGKQTLVVPNGQYVMKISALHALGDPSNPAHWDTWTSPVMTLARGAAQAGAVTGVAEGAFGGLELAPIEPNPSRTDVLFRFVLPEAGPASLEVFDVLGRRLRGWTWPRLPAGEHAVRWDGSSERGSTPAGVVVCRLSAMGRTVSRKGVRLP